jgi:hypothetical protein
METYTVKETRGIQIHLNWKPPTNMDFSCVNPNQVEYAFNTFFQQHPEMLEQIFKNLDNYYENQQTSIQIPEITTEKRDAILLSLMEASDNDNEDLDVDEIKSSRLNKDYLHNFFD